MFAAGEIEKMAKHYKSENGILVSGLWSTLISTSAEQSAEFARRYCHVFNDIVHGGWHLAVHAKMIEKNGTWQWAPNQTLHQSVEDIRHILTNAGIKVPNLCAVFFDPNNGIYDNRSVIIELNHNDIANESLYKGGFQATHACIMRSFDILKLSPYQTIPPEKMDLLLGEFKHQLNMKKLKSLLTKPIDALSNAALGAAVSKLAGA